MTPRIDLTLLIAVFYDMDPPDRISTISICPVASVPSGLAPLNLLAPKLTGSVVAIALVKWLISHVVETLGSPAFRKDMRSRDTISGSRLTATEERWGQHL